jgi:alpha-ketoglutarate-dependent 2,4-dichlorophenoxyacetate dioxygenase
MPSFEPLYRFFGARVDDVDLTSQLVEAVFAKIWAAFERYSLLVFSDHALRDDQKIVFSRWLGSLGMTKVGAMGEGTELLILTNVDLDDGATTPTDHRLHRTHHANSLWHTHRSFKKTGVSLAFIRAHCASRGGGDGISRYARRLRGFG